jgi:HTH-type transcriptional regulator/antitoxin HipB
MAMRVRSPKDLGAVIRARRRALGRDQATLARQARVSRLWVNQIEAGKPGASLGLVLRTLAVLGLEVELTELKATAADVAKGPDINAILERARKRP